jgi:hypothetical protein
MLKSLRVALSAFTIIFIIAAQTPAYATHEVDSMVPTQTYRPFCYGTTDLLSGMVCQTDNANVYWYADSNDPGELEANDVDSLENMLATQFAPTDLAIYYDSSPVFSGTAQTDIIYQESEAALPLPSGYRGWTWCNDDVGTEAYVCDQQYVRIQSPDGYRIFGGGLACHETGHAVGLLHGADAYPVLPSTDGRFGCMMNEIYELPYYLGSDQTHQINNTY